MSGGFFGSKKSTLFKEKKVKKKVLSTFCIIISFSQRLKVSIYRSTNEEAYASGLYLEIPSPLSLHSVKQKCCWGSRPRVVKFDKKTIVCLRW